MTKYLFQETADSLVTSYELLARQHKKHQSINKDSNSIKHGAHATSFPLLILNASIIEGIIRLWVTLGLKTEISKIFSERERIGGTHKNKAEVLLDKYLIDAELNGGNTKLREQFFFTYGVSIDKIEDFDHNSINILFTLRNVLVHGTAIISPLTPKSTKSLLNKSDYVDAWEEKLLTATTMLNQKFKSTDIFSALNNFDVPEFFFDQSKKYLELIHKEIEALNLGTGTAFEEFKKLKFGFISRT